MGIIKKNNVSVEESTKNFLANSIKNLKDKAIKKFELPKVAKSECLFINCKYYNVMV